MSRLFAGTPWDRPPSCDRCGKLESECDCKPINDAAEIPAARAGVAWLRLEKRRKGKVVSIVSGLNLGDAQLASLAATLKSRCGVGGTWKEDQIELQGDQIEKANEVLKTLGYRTKR